MKRMVSQWNTAEVAGVTFSDFDSAPVTKFVKPDPGPKLFQFENPTPVQTAVTINTTEIQQYFY